VTHRAILGGRSDPSDAGRNSVPGGRSGRVSLAFRAVSELRSVVSTQDDVSSAGFRRRWYALGYAEPLDSPEWPA
jgi:hypothetical protein